LEQVGKYLSVEKVALSRLPLRCGELKTVFDGPYRLFVWMVNKGLELYGKGLLEKVDPEFFVWYSYCQTH